MIGSNNAILDVARSMVSHATERQVVIAENIAHATTPNYKARDIASFQDVFTRGVSSDAEVDRTQAVRPNGNSVSLETQVMNLAETRGQHEMGLALWEQTLGLYRAALGRS
ncbi:MAG: flagellar biosynthesis protein FlgB [Pseudomonadota bacterium]